MMVSEVAKRYAGALYEVAGTNASLKLEELRAVEKVFTDNEIKKFVSSPLLTGEQKATAVAAAFQPAALSEDVKNLVLVLAQKDRLEEWTGIVHAFQQKTDEANGVVRGTVKSAFALAPDQRQAVEKRVSEITKKKVILEYKIEESLIGGLVAEVGSLTIDDSLETQLRLMNEELKRRAN